MKPGPPPVERIASDKEVESAFMDWVRRLVKGASELQALEAGQIDAIMDPATRSAVLLSDARAAMRTPVSGRSARTRHVAGDGRAARRIAANARAGAVNRLLASLPATEYARLLPGLRSVRLARGDVLHEPGQEMQHIYFPVDCVVSLLMVVDGCRSLEVGVVGREGMVGAHAALDSSTSPFRALVQGSGTALRIKSARFLREFHRSPALQRLLLRFTNGLMIQISQIAACNYFHTVQARLARWLLMTRERLPAGEFHRTQEFLADLLGVRRVSVTTAANALQGQKLIRYRRGNIAILDPQGLEAVCCACYRCLRLNESR